LADGSRTDYPEVERILWLLLLPSTSLDLKQRHFSKLCNEPLLWRNSTAQPVGLVSWVFENVRRFARSIPSIQREDVEDISENVMMQLWRDLTEDRIKAIRPLIAKNTYRPGELIRILATRLQWLIRAEKTGFLRNRAKAPSGASIDISDLEGAELRYGLYTTSPDTGFLERAQDLGADASTLRLLKMYVEGYTYDAIGRESALTTTETKALINRWRAVVRGETSQASLSFRSVETEASETEPYIVPESTVEEWDSNMARTLLSSHMSEADRNLLRMRYQEHMTATEIGVKLNMTNFAVRKRLQRARIKAAQVLGTFASDSHIGNNKRLKR
jgi:RNA polymerase sigma factor (sigma-70 family)